MSASNAADAGTADAASTRDERLKSALWYSLGQFVDEETLRLNTNATPQFIGALTEMVWEQIESVAEDLEAFARYDSQVLSRRKTCSRISLCDSFPILKSLM